MSHDDAKPLVLVVDDEINTTIMLQYIFEREGYRVEVVTDGATAVEVAEALIPDVILLDILLPRLNGFQVLAMLKGRKRTENIPTILITANAREPADVAQGMNLGADDYLYKPFAPQELLARVQSKVRARKLEDALRSRTKELEILLETSERLNQHLHRDELMQVVLQLAADLFSAHHITICLFNDDSTVQRSQSLRLNGLAEETAAAAVEACLRSSEASAVWSLETEPEIGCSGMFTQLQNNEQVLGILIVLSTTERYTNNQRQLLEGIGRQTAMALRNAELYQLQAQYTQALENTVQLRTSELVSAQRLLIRNEKLASIGHLAASIAHEINNPLMPVGLLLEQIEETLRAANSDIDFQDIEMVRENVLRIQRIVRSLLDFARQDGVLRDLDMGALLTGIAKLNKHHFELEQMQIVTTTTPSLIVHGSKDHLEAVFMNLALNARAAMKRGGTLTIGAQAQGDEVIIRFRDSGSGIQPEDIDKIFDPFFSTKQSGTGLGLFVCYSVISGHHGKIDVESTVGEGTTFTIRLPRADITP